MSLAFLLAAASVWQRRWRCSDLPAVKANRSYVATRRRERLAERQEWLQMRDKTLAFLLTNEDLRDDSQLGCCSDKFHVAVPVEPFDPDCLSAPRKTVQSTDR